MRESDLSQFTGLLDDVCSLLSRGAYTPNGRNAAIFFKALARYPFETVKAGFSAHVSDPVRGRFVPTPADVIGQIEGLAAKDGRPEADEAWATAVRCDDENETVVWTAETAHAWGVARPVMLLGDEVGARMAFKAAYARAVEQSRAVRQPVSWEVSEGHDRDRRTVAIAQAVAEGRVGPERLAAPVGPIAGLLELSTVRGCPPIFRQKLQELRDALAGAYEAESIDAEEKRATQQRKQELQARVDEAMRGYKGGKA